MKSKERQIIFQIIKGNFYIYYCSSLNDIHFKTRDLLNLGSLSQDSVGSAGMSEVTMQKT